MSLVDELREMEQQVSRRLQELEPMVAEYEELRKIVERIGSQKSEANRAGAAAHARPTRTRTRSRRVTKASGNRAASKPAPAVAAAVAQSARVAKPASAPKPKGARKTATNGNLPGKRDEDIIRLVVAQPGITVAQVGKELGVDPTGLYRVVKRLQASGHIRKQGLGLTSATS